MDSARIILLTLLLLLPLGAIEARLVSLQLSDTGHFIGDIFSRRRSLDLAPAQRGRILDRNGKVLAQDEWAFDLHAVLEEFEKRPEARADLQGLLGLPPDDFAQAFEKVYTRIEKLMNPRPEKERPRVFQRERRTPYVLFKNIPRAAAHAVETAPDRFPGLVVREGLRRTYPMGETGSHVIGMMGRASYEEYGRLLIDGYFTEGFEDLIGQDGIALLDQRGTFRETMIGLAGVEKSYDSKLRGKPGLLILERDPESGQKTWVDLKTPEPGEDVTLTIDIDAQRDVEKILMGQSSMATAVAADPMTGEILAMGSNALYDPNDFIPPTNNSKVTAYYKDERSPTMNRSVQSRFQLGSIFKIATSIAALEEGAVTPATIVHCNGWYLSETSKTSNCHVWNEHRGSHGDMNLRSALEQSCNCYYFSAAERLGLAGISKWADRLGFGTRTGVDLPGEMSGFLPTPALKPKWRVSESYSLVIGQHELAVTPVQVVRMMCAVANGGSLVVPHIGSSFASPAARIMLRPETLEAVNDGLRACVEGDHGTARGTGLREFNAGGKTGTAQTSGNKGTHAWFAGYAPMTNPKVAIVVLVEHAGHGGAVAGPLAASIVTRLLKEPPK